MELLVAILLGGLGIATSETLIAILVLHFVQNYQRIIKGILVGITLVPALTASVFSAIFLADPVHHDAWIILAVFVSSLALWVVFWHLVARNYGYILTHNKSNRRLIGVLLNNWIKSIDYIYLFLSTFSVLRIIVTAVTNGQGVMYFTASAAVLLGFAVALRVTKTSAEIFGWNEPPVEFSRVPRETAMEMAHRLLSQRSTEGRQKQ